MFMLEALSFSLSLSIRLEASTWRQAQATWTRLQVAYVEGSLWEALVQWPQPRKDKPKRLQKSALLEFF